VGQALIVPEELEVATVEAEETVVGADPEIADVILQKTVDPEIGQSIAGAVLAECVLLRRKHRRNEESEAGPKEVTEI